MKKQILFSLLFLGLCSVQLPAWAGDGATEEEVKIDCDEKTGICQWSAAIKDPLKDGGKAVKYYDYNKSGGIVTRKNATDAVGDTQYAKPGGKGEDSKTE